MEYNSLVLSVLIMLALCVWIYDLGKYTKNTNIGFMGTGKILSLILSILFVFIFFRFGNIKHNIFIFISFISVFVIFLFNLDRKYIYSGAIATLFLMPIFYFLDLLSIAENLAVLMCFLLLIGVTRDLFYDKIYK